MYQQKNIGDYLYVLDIHYKFECINYLFAGAADLAGDGGTDERDDHAAPHTRDAGQLPGAQQGARPPLPEQLGTDSPPHIISQLTEHQTINPVFRIRFDPELFPCSGSGLNHSGSATLL